MPATIRLSEEKRGTFFFLNYGDIEVLSAPSKIKDDLLLKYLSNLFDLVHLLQVMKDEEGEAPGLDPDWQILKEAGSASNIARNPFLSPQEIF